MLSVGSWLLDDLAPTTPARDGAERHLFLASMLLASRAHILDRIPDEGSFYDEGFHDPGRRFKCRKQNRRGLDEQPRYYRIGDRNLVNVPPL